MLHYIAANTTLCAMLLHAIWGCSCHHAHSDRAVLASCAARSSPSAAAIASQGCCCHRRQTEQASRDKNAAAADDSQQHNNPPDGTPRQGHVCQMVTCKFVSPLRVELPSDEDGRFEVLPLADGTSVVAAGLIAGRNAGSAQGGRFAAPPGLTRPESTQVWLL